MEEKMLSPHFSLAEMTRSAVAKAYNIDNTPPRQYMWNLMNLCNVTLERVRHVTGDVPVIINSGYRCPAVNDLVGGVKNSQHTRGEAADFYVKDYGRFLKFCYVMGDSNGTCLGWDFDQCIFYTSLRKLMFCHISYSATNNRHEIMYRVK